jgi:hypothetical protein
MCDVTLINYVGVQVHDLLTTRTRPQQTITMIIDKYQSTLRN